MPLKIPQGALPLDPTTFEKVDKTFNCHSYTMGISFQPHRWKFLHCLKIKQQFAIWETCAIFSKKVCHYELCFLISSAIVSASNS